MSDAALSKSKSKTKGGKNSFSSKRQVQGNGIFITTIRGKESRCCAEFANVLDEVADRLYPKDRLDELEKLRPVWNDTNDDPDEGEATAKVETDPMQDDVVPRPPKEEEDEEVEDDSIEASIAREIAALNPKKSKRQKLAHTSSQEQAQKKDPKNKPRFVSVDTSTECLAWPYDPLELCRAIVFDLSTTGVIKTKFAQRISPVNISMPAARTDMVLSQSKDLIRKSLQNYSDKSGKTEITYSIESSVRSHTDPLNRAWLLQNLGPLVVESATELSVSVKANLSSPDLVLLPQVFRKEFGLAIVEGAEFLGPFKKWNLDILGAEVNKKRFENGPDGGGDAIVNRSMS